MLNPTEARPAASYRSLVRDVELALLSEIGARAVFDHIARRSRDVELGRMAEGMNREGIDLVARVQELIRELGGRPRRTSFRPARPLAAAVFAMRAVISESDMDRRAIAVGQK